VVQKTTPQCPEGQTPQYPEENTSVQKTTPQCPENNTTVVQKKKT
jgi:hypothetical protein